VANFLSTATNPIDFEALAFEGNTEQAMAL
jgi:hypothetical protein